MAAQPAGREDDSPCAKMDALPVLYCDTFCLVCLRHLRQYVFFDFGTFTICETGSGMSPPRRGGEGSRRCSAETSGWAEGRGAGLAHGASGGKESSGACYA